MIDPSSIETGICEDSIENWLVDAQEQSTVLSHTTIIIFVPRKVERLSEVQMLL
jgi:hypothetical protein